ncbi:GTP cyclohydrolase FolE2 [Candidatus Electrothrix sp.]|uniref:GTP cyclohydrolase FolE2 n=1 Tax=Candidatus Electrothrix sp. TaxID=2170559 RepID=UPI0040566283
MKLQSVGIKNFTCPVSIREQQGGVQQTVAAIKLQAALPHHFKQSCLETFTCILAKYQRDMHTKIFPELLTDVQSNLQAEQAELEMQFPYFIAKQAPVTRTSSLMEYDCSFIGSIDSHVDNQKHKLLLRVSVPLTTLCPCSKEISQQGAHNQRAEVVLTVQPSGFIWLEELITMVESCGSCELYALLKRPDEKFVTEEAYANPMFVEDVVRKVAQKAKNHETIGWFSVSVESFESIHKHSAYAYVDSRDLNQECQSTKD